MAGAGKSSVGTILAHSLGWSFQDIDKLMEEDYGKPLQNILNELGDDSFIEEEASKMKELSKIQNAVIALAEYYLFKGGNGIAQKYIHCRLYPRRSKSIEERIDANSRGIVGLEGKTFQNF